MARAIVLVLGVAGVAAGVLLFAKRASAQNVDELGAGNSMNNSDGSITGAAITEDPSTWPGSDRIWNICAAIAKAEGYDGGAGVVPFDLNNPGDISDYASQYGSQPHSGSNVTTFPTAEVGWQKLYEKISNIVTGNSSVYAENLSWSGVAQKWAGDSSNWLNNVIGYLGVDANSTPADYVGGEN